MSVAEGDLTSLIESAHAAERVGAWDQALEIYQLAFSRLTAEGTTERAAELMRWIGTVHRERGDDELAREAYETSLAIAEAIESRSHVAEAFTCLGDLEESLGALAEAERLYTRAKVLAEELSDPRLLATIEQNRGALASIRGDTDIALLRYRAALRSYERHGDSIASACVLRSIGMAHVELADWVAAEKCLDEAFALAERHRDAGILGSIELNRAELYLKCGKFDRAREHCDLAFEIFSRLQSGAGLAEAYKLFGVLYRETAKPYLAESHFRRAVRQAKEAQDRLLVAESLREWAVAHAEAERNQEALRSLSEAHRIFVELHARRDVLDFDERLYGLEATYLKVVQAWGESIESKDQYTAGHCRRVADYTCMIAEAVGFTGRDLTGLRMSAYLHDVGKIAVPADVLNKPGKLAPEEWDLMKRHTIEGDAIVADLGLPWDIRPVVRNHHERWDGAGYPDGLQGEAIPLTARILCVADVYDALTSTRSFRPALSREEAMRIMEDDVGRLLDPKLFPIFRSLIETAGQIPDRASVSQGGTAA